MRPLPETKKTYGVIKGVRVTKEHLDAIGKALGITEHEKHRLREGDEIHIVREAEPGEMKKGS